MASCSIRAASISLQRSRVSNQVHHPSIAHNKASYVHQAHPLITYMHVHVIVHDLHSLAYLFHNTTTFIRQCMFMFKRMFKCLNNYINIILNLIIKACKTCYTTTC